MPVSAIDINHLLEFVRKTYAHALTLQELIEAHPELDIDEAEYDSLREKNDRYSQQQFALIFSSVTDPESFGRAVRAFLDTQPTDGRVH